MREQFAVDGVDRREFLTSATAAGVLTALGRTPVAASESGTSAAGSVPRSLRIQPRYHRWFVNPGVEWVEANTEHAHLDWTIPISQAALVLVDVWDRHYLKDTEARAEQIIQDKFLPLLAGCRQAGLTIIHAPSPGQAKRHPNWVNAGQPQAVQRSGGDWPPSSFRNKSGAYAAYRRPEEPRKQEQAERLAGLTLHPLVMPAGNEPVVATGEELHDVCRKAGILFLIFAGFNTNACILARDYGTLEMSKRGYEVILLRDCTTGMESRETHATLAQTNGAILLLEMFGQYSLTSHELLAGIT